MRGFKVPNSILKSRLKHSPLLVYLYLLSRQKNHVADLTFSQIATAINITEKSVFNAVNQLEARGLVIRKGKTRNGRTVATQFILPSPACGSWVWVESRIFELNLSTSELNVYLYIKCRENQSGRAWPSMSVIHKRYRTSQRNHQKGN